MISNYLGNDRHKLSLTSGIEIEVSDADIEEIVNENDAIKAKITKLENEVSKYKDYYHRADSKLETNRKNMNMISNVLSDATISDSDKLILITQQLKIE